MNRIDTTFKSLNKQHKTALIGFLTAGDPTLQTTKECIIEMDKNGCDCIEIGIPFSDPCAEGIVIQQANIRALKNKIRSDDIMQMVKEVRKLTQVPLLYSLYYNQIYKYGCKAFICACADCGIDGLIIPDLPYEHQKELQVVAQEKEIHLISTISPFSKKRKEKITQNALGFLYCMTPMEVINSELKAYVDELNVYGTVPKALVFDFATPAQIKEVKSYADGIIIGSAIVQEIAKITKGGNTPQDIGKFVASLTEACH